mgnify:FL=1
MLKVKRKIRSLWFILKFNGSILFLLGLSVWFGSLVFFGAGVAPVHFNLAEAWEMSGNNPFMPAQPVYPETIGGALTANTIERLNIVEMASAIAMTLGLALLWIPRINQTRWLIFLTATLAVNIALLIVYVFFIGERLFEIQQTIPLDFSISNASEKSAIHKEFDTLHYWYSMLTKINLFVLFIHFILLSVQMAQNRVRRLSVSSLTESQFASDTD